MLSIWSGPKFAFWERVKSLKFLPFLPLKSCSLIFPFLGILALTVARKKYFEFTVTLYVKIRYFRTIFLTTKCNIKSNIKASFFEKENIVKEGCQHFTQYL